MSQTKDGARRARETLKAKYGQDYYSMIGKKGADSYNAKDPATRPKRGFAWMKATGQEARLRDASRKGGSNGRSKDSEVNK